MFALAIGFGASVVAGVGDEVGAAGGVDVCVGALIIYSSSISTGTA